VKREEKLREKVLFSDLPFKEKIETYIDASLQQAKDYPYLETYLVSRINDGCFYKEEEEWEKFTKRFYKEFETEMKKRTIEKMEPIQFILNIASLVSFPVAIRPLFQSTMRISDAEYDRILSDRKEIIMKILFKN